MASILFNSPYEQLSLSESRRREQAIGIQQASNLMNTYFRSKAMQAEQERWDQEAPLRQAQLTQAIARADSEKSEATIRGIAAIDAAKRRESFAGIAAIKAEAAENGWDKKSEGKFRNFMTMHPEFIGSQEEKYIEDMFKGAEEARRREQQFNRAQEVELEKARIAAESRIRPPNGVPPAGTIVDIQGRPHYSTGTSIQPLDEMSPAQRILFEAEVSSAKSMFVGDKLTERLNKIEADYGLRKPVSDSSSKPGVAQPESGGVRKWVRGQSGNLGVATGAPPPEPTPVSTPSSLEGPDPSWPLPTKPWEEYGGIPRILKTLLKPAGSGFVPPTTGIPK